ncbi:MAG: cytochrome-c peroxidase [Bacteroidota bacterium]
MEVRKIYCIIIPVVLAIFLFNACQSAVEDAEHVRREKKLVYVGSVSALPATYISPDSNLPAPEKTELGRLLFYDPVLSGGRDVACATCHHPEYGYAESLDLSVGVNGKGFGEQRAFKQPNNIPFAKRNAPSLLNVAFNGIGENGDYSPKDAPMFWDNRARGLEAQALIPIATFEEMRGHQFDEVAVTNEIVQRLNDIPEYKRLFKKVFEGNDKVTLTNICKALAAFERSLLANNSRFDKYMRGDMSAMSGRELDGMKAFIDAGCARCHSGPMFSDFKPHVLGVAENEKLAAPDSGYQKTFAFRTPTVRNLRFTRPYVHNGKIQTIENVLLFYDDLHKPELPNKHVRKDQLDTLAVMMKLDFENINNIVDFLNALNDDAYDKKIPVSVPSGLSPRGNIK